MFVTRRLFDMWREEHSRQIDHMNEKYWSLVHQYDRLLDHLGLVETTIPEKVELRVKGGPERP